MDDDSQWSTVENSAKRRKKNTGSEYFESYVALSSNVLLKQMVKNQQVQESPVSNIKDWKGQVQNINKKDDILSKDTWRCQKVINVEEKYKQCHCSKNKKC